MRVTLIVLSFFCFLRAHAQVPALSNERAATYFEEMKVCSKKSFHLWNRELYGPILLVDPKTRTLFANEADSLGVLKAAGKIFRGVLPDAVNIANTAVDWSGKRWAMVLLPLSPDKHQRIQLLAHESFHRIQPALGFDLKNVDNNHLDQKEGRIYLRLELEALKQSLLSASERESTTHLENALIFRKYRHFLYGPSALSENKLELNEGLAELTGLLTSRRKDRATRAHLVQEINRFFSHPTFVRSFAYYTLPGYGYLLSKRHKNWQRSVLPTTDLTAYLLDAFGLRMPGNLKTATESLLQRYQGNRIVQEETAREEEAKKRLEEYYLKFVDNPHFEIKLQKMNVSFDPTNTMPVGDKGTFYPQMRMTDLWGVLRVENGVLMSPGWDKVSLSIPTRIEGNQVSGDGWTLELASGYSVSKEETGRNYILKKAQESTNSSDPH